MTDPPTVPAYLQQVARAYRFLDRFKNAMTFDFPADPNGINELEDNLWAFFQNCWHVKDWLRHDPNISKGVKDEIWDQVKANPYLPIVADLANGSKHFATDPNLEWVGAAEAPTQVAKNADGTWTFTHIVDLPDGSRLTALELAERAMAEWQKILKAHDLLYYMDSGAP